MLHFAEATDFFARLERIGHMPLPPYIHRDDSQEDKTRYQTVYAGAVGSAAAPTAGLHFTPEMLVRLEAAGVEVRYVTLHVGLGTFQPLRVERLEDIRLHRESYTLPEAHSGSTDIFIAPGFRFRVVDGLLTNFHLPQSSLLMLVSAFCGGRERVLAAYAHAVRERYRFFSYGDCMLIL